MGNTESNIGDPLFSDVRKGQYHKYLVRDQHVAKLDLAGPVDANEYHYTYTATLEPALHSENKNVLAFIFPDLEKERNRVLLTTDYKTYGGFNKELNRRITKVFQRVVCSSGDNSVRFYMLYNRRFILVRNVYNTLYFCWAKSVRRQNINNIEWEIGSNIPVLLNMDGRKDYRSITIFPKELQAVQLHPQPKEYVKLLLDFHYDMYPCDLESKDDTPLPVIYTTQGAQELTLNEHSPDSSDDEISFGEEDDLKLHITNTNNSEED